MNTSASLTLVSTPKPTSARVHPVVLKGESLNWVVRQNPTLFTDAISAWFRSEAFAQLSHVGTYNLDFTGRYPAVVYAVAFVNAHKRDGTILWPSTFLPSTDCDNLGRLVYIGRAAEYGYLQVHRWLKEGPFEGTAISPDYPI